MKKESFPHPQKYQNKSRFIQSSHYVVDYDAIFAESGGQLKDYWELPLEIDRNLDNVPSKKRSMYRKRYACLLYTSPSPRDRG